MNSRISTAVLLVACIACALPALADSSIPANATVVSTLNTNVGKSVTVRLAGGEELTGVVRAASDKTLILVQLSGREFFDAVITLASVQAVIVRNR